LFGCSEKLSGVPNKAKPKMDMHRVQAGNLDADGWCIAQSTQGPFQVTFPGHFNDFTVSGADTNGSPVETFALGTLTADNTKYSATLMTKEEFKRNPPGENFLNGFLDDFKANGTLKHSDRASYHGQPCIQAEVGDVSRSATMRVILHGQGVYMLIAEFDTDRGDKLKGTIATFMNSLEFASATNPT
jgi:hypothetical protein